MAIEDGAWRIVVGQNTIILCDIGQRRLAVENGGGDLWTRSGSPIASISTILASVTVTGLRRIGTRCALRPWRC